MSREPEMQRRVAKVIARKMTAYGVHTDDLSEFADEVARETIREMYNPTDAMKAAYMNSLESRVDEKKEPWHRLKMLKRWHAMIDAASPE